MSPTDVDVQQHDLELPTGWAKTKFEDIYELAYGKSLTKVAQNTDGNYPVYGSNGIVGHHDTFLVDGPALIVGRKGAAGIVSFSAKPCWPIDTTGLRYWARIDRGTVSKMVAFGAIGLSPACGAAASEARRAYRLYRPDTA